MSEDTGRLEDTQVEVPAAELAQVAALRAKLVQAELRTAAARAGMIDLDGIKLVDWSGLSVDDAGELAEAPEIMARLRQQKPWLFGRGSSSSPDGGAARDAAEAEDCDGDVGRRVACRTRGATAPALTRKKSLTAYPR